MAEQTKNRDDVEEFRSARATADLADKIASGPGLPSVWRECEMCGHDQWVRKNDAPVCFNCGSPEVDDYYTEGNAIFPESDLESAAGEIDTLLEEHAHFEYCEGAAEAFKDAPPPFGPEPDQIKATNPKDLLAEQEGRALLHLIPGPALIHVAKAMEDGARKYGPYNWREEGVGAGTYVSAAHRHLMDWFDGEENAPDSDVHHLAHAAACCLILLDAQAIGNLVDDRPLPAPTSEMMEAIKAGEHPSTAHRDGDG